MRSLQKAVRGRVRFMQDFYAVKVIMRWFGWAAVLVLTTTAMAQQIPAGTVIPVMLNTGLNAGKDGAGKNIEGKVMQDVSTPLGFTISRGSRITGQIVSAGKSGGSDSSLVLKFDSIQDHGRSIPLTAAVLAVASMQSVAQAQAPINSNSDMVSASGWVTRQVGGDVVSRSQRKVGTPGGLTGTWLEDSSVLIKLTPNADAGCPSGPGYDRPQAVWIFSSSACGTYDLGSAKIANSGTTPPLGNVSISSDHNLQIRGGSAWLLITVDKK
jgi:hypothetical protein